MLRRALTYQLILAVAVGPLLCCCSVGKVLAGSPSTSNAPVSSHTRAPAERVSHSCCSHKHQPSQSDPTQKSAPSKPGTPADKCPCKDGSSDQPQTTQAEPTQTSTATFLRFLALDAVAAFVSPGAGELAAADVGGPTDAQCLDHFFSTAAELLYAHHNLRC